MAVRSLNIKMHLSRKEDGDRVRQSLWLTHSIVNEAVAKFEQVLLLCRGRDYHEAEDELVPAEKVQQEALAFARKVQAANGKEGAGSDEEVLSALRSFYEALVSSVLLDEKGNPLKGDAQASRAFASPMMDAESTGFQSVFEKVVDPLPDWVAKAEDDPEAFQVESNQWLESSEAQGVLAASDSTGRKPTWISKLRKEQPWQEDFIKDQEKKRKDIDGVALLIRRLKQDLGLLPLLAPPITFQLQDASGRLTPWDRLALRLAVGHLLSWESWNHRAKSEHARVAERIDRHKEQTASLKDLFEEIRSYETDRHEELRKITQVDDGNPFRIGKRATRGWGRIREVWLAANGATEVSRKKALAELQTKLGGRFGDHKLFGWLAEDGREHLWESQDPLPALATLNALERLLKRKKDYALYTPPDARIHPRWTMYEAPGGGNLRNYGLEIHATGAALKLPILVRGEGGLEEERFAIPLAPSDQLQSPAWKGNGKDRKLAFYSAHQDFTAKLGGCEILLDRRHLENRSPEQLDNGNIGRVWLKLVLDVDSKAPADWLDGRGRVATPSAFHHFNTAIVNKSRHADKLELGLRVLSVDLGLRTFASCSVFELVKGEPKSGLAFLADREKDLWARHERSFLLKLPGEAPDVQALAARRGVNDELGLLRRDLGRLKDVLRLSVKAASQERELGLEELRKSLEDERSRDRVPAFEAADLRPLEDSHAVDQAAWEAKVREVHRTLEGKLADRVGQWRRRTRPRMVDETGRRQPRAYAGGKSVWAVDYLDRVRRFLKGWSLHGQKYGEINRMDREKQGTFAAHLLRHINALKQDRIRAGGDLIIQAARGYLPAKNKGWVSKYEPCRVIMFEDLARYRFRTDRPRWENSQLMRWNHRQIVDEAKMQAELYGIVVGTIGAGFTSRFHARSGSPGPRTRVLSPEDLQAPGLRKRLEFLAERLGISFDQLRPGMRVPWEGGEDLATAGKNGSPTVIHADVNAAQNLQRRFWTRHADAFRITAVKVEQGDRSAWYPDRDGVRLRGALSTVVGSDGYARLMAAEDGDGFVLEKVTRPNWRQATGKRAEQGDEAAFDEVEAELADAAENEDFQRGEGREVFFRDPSGLVLRADRWYEAKVFWGTVHRRVADALGICETKIAADC